MIDWSQVIPAEDKLPKQDDYARAIQEHIDSMARSRDYESGIALLSYMDDQNVAWAAEANAFKQWRSAVWAYAYAQLDAVQSGSRDRPSIEGLIVELPSIEWPS